MITKNSKRQLIYFIILLAIAFIKWNVASANSAPPENAKSAPIVGHGTIEAIDLAKHQLTIKHDAIEALNWPPMTMPFTVDEKLDIIQLKPGTAINFHLENDRAGQRVITQIENANTNKGQ